jgi:conjugal transfer mating pair stabilization protein TraN
MKNLLPVSLACRALLTLCALVCAAPALAETAAGTPSLPRSASDVLSAAKAAAKDTAAGNSTVSLVQDASNTALVPGAGSDVSDLEALFEKGQGNILAPGAAETEKCLASATETCQAVQVVLETGSAPSWDEREFDSLLAGKDTVIGSVGGLPAPETGVACETIKTEIPPQVQYATCDSREGAAEESCFSGWTQEVSFEALFTCIDRQVKTTYVTCNEPFVASVQNFTCLEAPLASCTEGASLLVESAFLYECAEQSYKKGSYTCNRVLTAVGYEGCAEGSFQKAEASDDEHLGKDPCNGGDAIYLSYACGDAEPPTLRIETNVKNAENFGFEVSSLDFEVERDFSNCRGKWTGRTRCSGVNCTSTVTMDVWYKRGYGTVYSGSLTKVFAFTTKTHDTERDVWQDTCVGIDSAAAASTSSVPSEAAPAAELSYCRDTDPVCVDGPGEKYIDGVKVWRECWNYERRRECLTDETVNFCAGLEKEDACTKLDTVCEEAALTGECLRSISRYRCSEEAEDAGSLLVDFSHTVNAAPDNTCANFLENPSCEVAREVCLEEGGTRVINGVAVTKDCWKKELYYACASMGVANSCSTLIAAGCDAVDGPVCVRTAADGACEQYQRTFRCVNAGTFDDGTILPDGPASDPGFDSAACSAATAGLSCSVQSSLCTEEGGTKEINGVPVTADCWNTQKVFRCEESVKENSCGTLETTAGCTVKSSRCAERLGMRCLAYEKTIECVGSAIPAPPEPDVSLGSSSAILGDWKWDSTCEALENHPSCAEQSRECAERPGGSILLPEGAGECLRWETSFLCQADGLTSDCDALEANPKCTLIDSLCHAESQAAGVKKESADCASSTQIYACIEEEGRVTETEVCRPASCLAGFCDDVNDTPDTDFASVIARLEAAREGAVYGDLDGNRFFGGEADFCTKKVLGFSCCDAKVKAGTGNSAFGAGLTFAGQIASETIKTFGSPYVYDVLSASEATSGLLTMMYGNAASGVYNPSLSFYGFAVTFQEGQMLFTFNPATFAAAVAVQVAMEYLQCEQSEQTLMLKKGQNLCRYVGTYCSLKTGFACAERKESYCCFNSVLARLIQTQGAEQLARPADDAKSPACTGFTVDELASLDFDAMDFSEFVTEILGEADLTADFVKDRLDRSLTEALEKDLGGTLPAAPGVWDTSASNRSKPQKAAPP